MTEGMKTAAAGGARRSWRASCPAFWLFFFYTVLIWCCEALDLLCFLTGLPQVSAPSRILALVLAWLIVRRFFGRPRFEKSGADLLFAAGCLFIAVFFAVKAIRPDMSYDTQNYHLLCQIPGFADNLHFHALPGRFQMFGFRLGDRMFYPFRALLGLRMGTLLTAVSVLVCYCQLTAMYAWFQERIAGGAGDPADRAGREKKRFAGRIAGLASLLAFLTVSRFELIQESASYMVELQALPFFLEMVFLLIREPQKEDSFREAVLFCFLGGILFAMKMTNVTCVAPLILLYLWKIRRQVTPALFAAGFAAGLSVSAVYLIYNMVCTGNPIYPYYNTVFGSPYYYDAVFKDGRWGPQSAAEILFWPLHMILRPQDRLSELPAEFNLDLAALYAAAAPVLLWSVWRALRGKRFLFQPEGVLAAAYIVSIYAWAATTGHVRYFMSGLLLGGILLSFLILRLCAAALAGGVRVAGNGGTGPGRPVFRGGIRAAALLAAGVLLLVMAGRAEYAYRAVWNGREWSFRDGNREIYERNWRFVLRDHELFPPELLERIDRLFLTWMDCGSYARMAGEDIPVWNRYAIMGELEQFSDRYMEELEAAMERGEGVYDMFSQGWETLLAYLEWVNEAGWYVTDLWHLDTIMEGAQSYTAAGLTSAGGRTNTWYIADSGTGDGFSFEKEADLQTFTALWGDPDYWLVPYPFEIGILASDGQSEKLAAVAALGEREYERKEVTLDLTGLSGEITLTFRSRDGLKRAIVLNPEWK